MENSKRKDEDIYRFYFIMGIVFMTMGNVIMAVIDGVYGLFGLAVTIPGLILLLICLKNRDKWAKNPAPEN